MDVPEQEGLLTAFNAHVANLHIQRKTAEVHMTGEAQSESAMHGAARTQASIWDGSHVLNASLRRACAEQGPTRGDGAGSGTGLCNR